MTPVDGIEWLDDDGVASPPDDEELTAGATRPPMRRRTRIALGVAAAAVLGIAVTVGVTAGDDQKPTALATPAPSTSRVTTPTLPARPAPSTLAALRSAFPGAVLTGYVAVLGAGPAGEVFRIYNLTSGRRRINVTLRPAHDNDRDGVYRAYSSLEIAQSLGSLFVQATVRVTKGQPSAKDFAAIQQLVQDARLLAAR